MKVSKWNNLLVAEHYWISLIQHFVHNLKDN